MNNKIFIPSRGRYENSPTLNMAVKDSAPVTVFVEPQEVDNYKKNYPQFEYVVLPESNKGITFVRNYMKEYAQNLGYENYWQIDDDITNLYYRTGKKLINANFSVLFNSEQQFIEAGVALGALEFRPFAWSATTDLLFGSYCNAVVFVNLKLIPDIWYRDFGKEDIDFAMQVIRKRLKTARTTLYAFATPPLGSNAGGLKEIYYDLGSDARCVDTMIETWGSHICKKIVKPSGRVDVKVNWKNIHIKYENNFF